MIFSLQACHKVFLLFIFSVCWESTSDCEHESRGRKTGLCSSLFYLAQPLMICDKISQQCGRSLRKFKLLKSYCVEHQRNAFILESLDGLHTNSFNYVCCWKMWWINKFGVCMLKVHATAFLAFNGNVGIFFFKNRLSEFWTSPVPSTVFFKQNKFWCWSLVAPQHCFTFGSKQISDPARLWNNTAARDRT